MKKLNNCFVITMMVLIAIFIWFLGCPPSIPILASQKSVIFLEGKDWFADFFNMMLYISDESGYYFSTINEADGHSGFPLSIAILYPFTLLVDYTGMSLQDCWASKSAIFSCVSFLIVISFFYWDSLSRLCDKYNVGKYNLVVFLFSSVFIFSLERANFIFIAAALINYYLTYYDSSSVKLRRFALVCLCISSTLKGYPVFFGLLLLKEKRYKDILFCIVFTLLIALVPFAFMDKGFENLPKMIENIGLNSASYIHNFSYMFGLHKITYLACMALHLPETTAEMVISSTRVVELLLLLLSFVLVLAEKRLYRQCMLIACCILLFPINSGFYCALYLLPTIIVFFEDRLYTKVDILMMLLLCVVINPLQVNIYSFHLSSLASNIALVAIWMTIILSSLSMLKINIIK